MKRISLLIAMISCAGFAKAQFVNDYVAAADKYFLKGDYYSAAQYYEKSMAPVKSKSEKPAYHPYEVTASSNKKKTVISNSQQKVIYNMAECYRKLHYHEKAAPLYLQATSFDKAAFPLAKFHYGTTLRAMEKYDEATATFNSFLSEYTVKDNYAATAALEVQNIAFIKKQLARKDLSAYTVQKSSALNATEGGSYAPVWMGENTLWFTSTRPQGTEKNKSNTNRIYQAEYANGNAGPVSLTDVPQPNDMQQGVVSATADGNTLYLTRWVVANSKKTAAIYSSKKAGGKWSDPVLVPGLNVPGSNSQQPYVMPDGKNIVFVSDRTGGLGGLDLWMATLDASGNIGAPVNMGNKINTVFDEQAPSYHAATGTFIFSTNGRVGMGGYDFFYSKGTLDNLSEPKNFGYPVNSFKDDLYFVSKGPARNILENVVLSSDRDASCCLELFTLNRLKRLKQLSGQIISCKDNSPLAGVSVQIIDTLTDKVVEELKTGPDGKYSFTLEEFMPLKAAASDSGYYNNSMHFYGPEDKDEETFVNQDLCLVPMIPDVVIKVNNVYYDFNKSKLQKASFPELDKLVQLLNDNPGMRIELSSHTDSKGDDAYNMKLSDARAESVVKYLISKGIDKSRLEAKGYGESMPVAENQTPDGKDNPEGRQQNRRTEFKVLKN